MENSELTYVEENKKCFIRVSLGTAIVLKLIDGLLSARPTTAYLLTYHEDKCLANCGFCSQARDSTSEASMLSRITWPLFNLEKVLINLKKTSKRAVIKRICIQALNYPRVLEDLLEIIDNIKSHDIKMPISASCQPLDINSMRKLANAGVERIAISLDATIKSIFTKVKGKQAGGPYRWLKHHNSITKAKKIFGENKVSTHFIIGLGETEKEAVKKIQWSINNKVNPALFAFTPIPGTPLENTTAPPVNSYRRIQIARYLIILKKSNVKRMTFDLNGKITSFGIENQKLFDYIKSGKPFLTTGCENCNRPFYNEKPSGPLYNFPILPKQNEIKDILDQIFTS